MKRAASAAYWTVPSLLCLAIYWYGLKTWFQQDDFAWLSLNRSLREGGDLWTLLFQPMAQGTFRPLSERAFFLIFHGLFGLNALPFRIAVFLTQFANLVLLSSIARRLTRSRAVGFLAPVLWIANGSLATLMAWTSAYNEVLCACFLLASLWFLLKHIETGQRRYYAWQWATFLAGFGALELMVVYPAIAVSYAFLAARSHLRKTLWLLPASVIYAVLHMHFAPAASTGPYRMHLDGSMWGTLGTYWRWALAPARLVQASIVLPAPVLRTATLLLTLALVGFVLVQLRKGNRLGVFLLLWFLILIAPVLPLRDHITDYYVSMPTIGLAILGAWALAEAWKQQWYRKMTAVVLAAVYLACSVPVARAATRWNYNRSRAARSLVLGLARAHELHPGKVILLAGVNTELFYSVVRDKGYRLAGLDELYLTPGSENSIQAHDEIFPVTDFVLPAATTLRAMEHGLAMVYAVEAGRLRSVTADFRKSARLRFAQAEQPWRVDAGSALFTDQLGPSWYGIDGGYRWMPKRASVGLRGPRTTAERLRLSGFCPAEQLRVGPLKMTVSVDGVEAGSALLTREDAAFDVAFRLPAQALGKPRIEVTVEVDRTIVTPTDSRTLGLVFGTFAIR